MKKPVLIKKVKRSNGAVLPPLGWTDVLAQKGFAAASEYIGETSKFIGPLHISRSSNSFFEGRLSS